MLIEIKSRWSGSVLFSLETSTLKLAVEAAIKSGVDLRGADLTTIRDDYWAVLSAVPAEVQGLRDVIFEGRINGSSYHGECACLVGTIANVRHCAYDSIDTLKPDSSRPAERFFLAIKNGDKPETNQFSKLALEWTDQWLSNMRAAFGAQPKEL